MIGNSCGTGTCAGVTTGVATADAGFNGLTGLVGLVGFVIDLTQVFELTAQSPHTGDPYGSGQDDALTCSIAPV